MNDLRAGWPEEVLTGQYWFQRTGGTAAREVVSFLTDDLLYPDNDTSLWTRAGDRIVMQVFRNQHPGIKAVRAGGSAPWLTLLQHVRSPQGEEPYLLHRMRRQMSDKRYTFRSRLRRARREFTADMARLQPTPLQVWDVLDNRADRFLGRLTVPIGVPGARTAIHGATGRTAAHLMAEGELLTVRTGARPVAQFTRVDNAYRVDVAGAAPAGLDPRLVLACALLRYARLSDK
ncbi:hypothetical protein JIG36_04135 [Actinoplanes sp. LDG1-06]|uniref:TIGR03083 family protein n=1 Tax=Paractinoplanes ovalisporus TaxID=2810368 RepID=A0ABS2A4H0_9ACTN|nr:hypothetical protein [Actinoplanes ovalisporus]MBM2614743.1 hypothetical protein [Actinoplanes ovalisporus]